MKPNWKKKWMKWIWLRFNSIETEIYFQNWEKKTNTHQWMNENNMKWNANMKKARSRVFFSFFFLLSSICKWTNFGHFDRENTHTEKLLQFYYYFGFSIYFGVGCCWHFQLYSFYDLTTKNVLFLFWYAQFQIYLYINTTTSENVRASGANLVDFIALPNATTTFMHAHQPPV